MMYKLGFFLYNSFNMKRYFWIEIFFIIVLILFCIFQYIVKSENIVIKVFSPVRIAVDANHDGKVQSSEIFCISGIKTFGDEVTDYNKELAQKEKLSVKDAISLAYMAKDFAKRTLIGKNVRLKPLKENAKNCTYADIWTDNKNYKKILYDNGFGYDETLGFNKEAFSQNLEKAKKLHPVVFNRKSAKYHEVDCKYGRVAENYTIILEEDLPEDAIPCQWCQHPTEDTKIVMNTVFPDKISDGDIEIVLTDMTRSSGIKRDCATYICKAVVEKINSAQKSIDIAAYGWVSIPKIDNALKNAIVRGVKLRYVYDFDKHKKIYPDNKNVVDIAEASKNDADSDKASEIGHHMHNKFMVIDNEKIMTGSLNFSDTDFSAHNSNFVAFINSKEIAQIYTDEFEQMLSGKFHSDKKKRSNYSKYIVGNSEIEVYFSPQDKTIKNHLKKYINSAKKYIYIPAFIITYEEFEGPILSAHKRGVDIKIITDATTARARRSCIQNFRDNNIPVKIENYAGKIHSKSIIIDDEYVIAGSMNFSNSGENHNDENTLIIKNERLAKFYREFFEYFWNKIPDKYLTKYPHAEGPESVGSCFDGIDNDYDGKIDSADKGCTYSSAK